ncbi:hypothetical protein HELRODRAFT_170122 [Helobdella robusta]|uniref:Uncharacterized protein n=1 Tax=Helobdella robusta TaxID=6412 RepID=T1F2P0_HELRO|nr:hypothetical protein HELRODRAFT_170122 [Helobdella robusta]ESO07576.1 hypothetical protein HELRODRAFT_170122 [Helobdella robusta]
MILHLFPKKNNLNCHRPQQQQQSQQQHHLQQLYHQEQQQLHQQKLHQQQKDQSQKQQLSHHQITLDTTSAGKSSLSGTFRDSTALHKSQHIQISTHGLITPHPPTLSQPTKSSENNQIIEKNEKDVAQFSNRPIIITGSKKFSLLHFLTATWLLLLLNVETCVASGRFQLKLMSYYNPRNELANGTCCPRPSSTMCSSCKPCGICAMPLHGGTLAEQLLSFYSADFQRVPHIVLENYLTISYAVPYLTRDTLQITSVHARYLAKLPNQMQI